MKGASEGSNVFRSKGAQQGIKEQMTGKVLIYCEKISKSLRRLDDGRLVVMVLLPRTDIEFLFVLFLLGVILDSVAIVLLLVCLGVVRVFLVLFLVLLLWGSAVLGWPVLLMVLVLFILWVLFVSFSFFQVSPLRLVSLLYVQE